MLIRLQQRIAFAQDSLQRHVVLKLIKNNGHEYQIVQLLSKQSSLSSLEGFGGVLAPLDIFDITDHCILVYPRYIPACLVFDHFSCMTL